MLVVNRWCVLVVTGLSIACSAQDSAPSDGVPAGGQGGGGSGGQSVGGSGAWPSGGTAGAGGASSGGAGQGGTPTGGGSGGSGGAPLPCDSRFSFSQNPVTAGSDFTVTFKDTPGYVYIGMDVTGPGSPVASDLKISGAGPYSWSWKVSGHGAGTLKLTFTKDNGTPVASCQIGSNPSSGGGGSGGGGTGGTGGGGTGGGGTGGGGTGGTGGGNPVGTCADQPVRNRFAMNVDPANPKGNPSASDLRTLGARWARIEWKVGISAATQKSQIAALRSGGVRVLLIFDYASVSIPSPGSSGSSSSWTSYRAQYVQELGNLVASLGTGIDAWEVWNEPDLAPSAGYDPYVPPATYGALLKDAYTKLKASTSAPVIVGGLASGNPSYLTQAKNAAGGLFADGVGIHPYGQRAPDNWPNSTWGFGNMSALFGAYLAFGKPVWVTEIGTVDSGNQAQYLKNVYALAAGYGTQVPVVFWFCWSDGMVPPFGVLDSAGGQKPAYSAFKSVAPAWNSSCEH